MEIDVFLDSPEGFASDLSVAGCYLLFKETFLLLKRHPKCLSGKKWCLPGGKLEEGETHIEGARRELYEEVGIALPEKKLSPFLTFYIERKDLKYDFSVFIARLEEKPPLQIDLKEHTEGQWVTHQEIESFPLIHGGREVLENCLRKRLLSSI